MRQTISGLVAAIAVMTASAVPAMACGGGGLLQSGCSPCGQAYVSPCEQQMPVYVAPAPVSNCDSGCGGWARERLPDPVQQYYYVDQGPTYTGPGNFAPYRTYQEGRVSGWGGYRHHHSYRYGYQARRYAEPTPRYDGGPRVRGSEFYGYRARPHFRAWREHMGYRYPVRPSVRYGYVPHRYAPRYSLPQRQFQAPHRSLRYGGPAAAPRVLGTREHLPRRYN